MTNHQRPVIGLLRWPEKKAQYVMQNKSCLMADQMNDRTAEVSKFCAR